MGCFNSDMVILSGVSGAGGAPTVTSPDYGFDSPNSGTGETVISSPKRPDQPLGSTLSPVQWIAAVIPPGIKRMGRVAYHPSSYSSKVKVCTEKALF
jgi:hypothetical protein